MSRDEALGLLKTAVYTLRKRVRKLVGEEVIVSQHSDGGFAMISE